MRQAVVCMVSDVAVADSVVESLKLQGFNNSDVSILMPDNSGVRDFGYEKHSKAPEGTSVGAGTGAVLGGTLGWLAGVGALAIPGVGPFIAAGPIMAGLSGAAVGSAVGGVTGGLIGLGMPEFEAKLYERKLKDGNILISVHTEDKDEAKRVEKLFKAAGARDISSVGEERVKSKQ